MTGYTQRLRSSFCVPLPTRRSSSFHPPRAACRFTEVERCSNRAVAGEELGSCFLVDDPTGMIIWRKPWRALETHSTVGAVLFETNGGMSPSVLDMALAMRTMANLISALSRRHSLMSVKKVFSKQSVSILDLALRPVNPGTDVGRYGLRRVVSNVSWLRCYNDLLIMHTIVRKCWIHIRLDTLSKNWRDSERLIAVGWLAKPRRLAVTAFTTTG